MNGVGTDAVSLISIAVRGKGSDLAHQVAYSLPIVGGRIPLVYGIKLLYEPLDITMAVENLRATVQSIGGYMRLRGDYIVRMVALSLGEVLFRHKLTISA